GPRPGLLAPGGRRAGWKPRGEGRGAGGPAIALSPAVMLAVAGLRSDGDPARAPSVEDAPSLEFTLGAETGRALRELHPIPRVIGAPDLERATAAQAEAGPTIDWHHAVSLGLPYDGSLIDGTQLPVEGPDSVPWDPVTP